MHECVVGDVGFDALDQSLLPLLLTELALLGRSDLFGVQETLDGVRHGLPSERWLPAAQLPVDRAAQAADRLAHVRQQLQKRLQAIERGMSSLALQGCGVGVKPVDQVDDAESSGQGDLVWIGSMGAGQIKDVGMVISVDAGACTIRSVLSGKDVSYGRSQVVSVRSVCEQVLGSLKSLGPLDSMRAELAMESLLSAFKVAVDGRVRRGGQMMVADIAERLEVDALFRRGALDAVDGVCPDAASLVDELSHECDQVAYLAGVKATRGVSVSLMEQLLEPWRRLHRQGCGQ